MKTRCPMSRGFKIIALVALVALLVCTNGFALTDEEIVGEWDAEISTGICVAVDFYPGHSSAFLLIQSELSPNWKLQADTVVLNFPEDDRHISTNKVILLRKEADGLHFLRSGLLDNMPEEMEQAHLRRSGWGGFRRIEARCGGAFYDLKDKELPSTLSNQYIEVLIRLWQHDKESIATIVRLPNTTPERLLWAYRMLPTNQWWSADEVLALAIAGNAHTPLNILEDAWKSWKGPEYWRAIACNPATSNSYWDAYTNKVLSGSVGVRANAAEDLALPVTLMEILAQDKDEFVASRLAYNKNAPSNIVAILAKHPDENVRRAAALHPNISPQTQMQLAQDDRPYVLRDLLMNSKLINEAREEAISRLARSPEEGFRVEAASRVNSTSESYRVLLTDYSPAVRKALAGNPTTPVSDLLKFAEDDFLPVRQVAVNRLASQDAKVTEGLKERLRPEEDLRQSLDLRSEIIEAVRHNDLVFIKWVEGIAEYKPLFNDMVDILKVVLESDNREMLDYFTGNSQASDALISAVENAGHIDPALLQHIIRDKLISPESHFALMSDCVEKGRSGLLQQLIALGLDPCAKGPRGATLLHIAVERYNPEMVDYLIKQGASVSALDDQQRTPVDIAAINYSIALLIKLDKAGKYARMVEGFRKEFSVPASSPFIGTWVKRKEGFGSCALFLAEDGTGFFATDAGSFRVAWKQSGSEAHVFMLERYGPVRKDPLIFERNSKGALVAQKNPEVELLKEEPKAQPDESHVQPSKGRVIRFPDKNFAQAVRSQLLSGNPAAKQIYDTDVKGATVLRVHELNISNLMGLAEFVGLMDLQCGNNSLAELDVSECRNLRVLSCCNNPLTNLNLTACTNLYSLDCFGTALTNLDLSACGSLHKLDCCMTPLTSLNLSACTNLTRLNCAQDKLTVLFMPRMEQLENIDCSKNMLSELDLSASYSLKELVCDRNSIQAIELPNRTNLWRIICDHNSLTNLDVSGCSRLREIHCFNNQGVIANVNVSGCVNLGYLFCGHSGLAGTLDVSTCTNLVSVNVEGNQLSEIIVCDTNRLPRDFKYDSGVKIQGPAIGP